jgi:hypothetical protein
LDTFISPYRFYESGIQPGLVVCTDPASSKKLIVPF